MQTTSKIFVSCLFCLVLSLISGCGGSGSLTGTPSFTPAEQAEVDKLITEHGRNALLHLDMRDGQLALKYAKYLVSQGANVNAKDDNSERTPLHRAMFQKNIDIEVVKFLISKGADVNAVAKASAVNVTALDIARGCPNELEHYRDDYKENEAVARYLESVGAKSRNDL